ncbi:MAG: CBS domain-containing protein, partial [Myxococcota bacterium]
MDPSLASLPVDALMRRHFICVSPDDSTLEVERLMQFARLRRLLVVHDGVLVGVLSYRSLALALLHRATRPPDPADGGEELPVSALMEPVTETVAPDTQSTAAVRQLCLEGGGCLPVVEASERGPRLVGLVTESHLLAAAFGRSLPQTF